MGGPSIEAAAVALASLPDINPHRLRAIRQAYGFERGWQAVLDGRVSRHPRLARCLGEPPTTVEARMARDAARLDPVALLSAHQSAGVQVVVLGDDRYPSVLAADHEPPAVLFARGDLARVAGRRVAVVGTRRCTRGGSLVAFELGAELARAGVTVVSGLALGIDGAAHDGALSVTGEGAAPVVGVVGSGLDVVYPKRHAALWERVARHGVLLSEWPLGTEAVGWRFPLRNRIIAALADLVVVVESHTAGGSLNTVEQATRRGREVMAVPGSVRSPASAGTNALLFDGASPARDAADVLGALGFASTGQQSLHWPDPAGGAGEPAGAPVPEPADLELLELLGAEARTLDQLAADSGRDLADLAVTVLRFELQGWVVRTGTWVERVAR